jgi:prefoldin subunit 5
MRNSLVEYKQDADKHISLLQKEKSKIEKEKASLQDQLQKLKSTLKQSQSTHSQLSTQLYAKLAKIEKEAKTS